jgi:phosphoglycolate phosphatase-like HAD superfamily hydrolase
MGGMPSRTDFEVKRDGLVVLDFDGVIADSIHDSWMTAVNAFVEMFPNHGLPVDGPIPPDGVFEFERRHPELFSDFKRLIPLGNRAADYLAPLRLIARREADGIKDQKDFDTEQAHLPPELRERFGALFYELRIRLQDADPESWAGLIPAFPSLPEAVRELDKRFRLAIATSKDRRSVDILLRRYGLADCFSPGLILDKAFSYSKRLHLLQLSKSTGVTFDRIHFVDDKTMHLVQVKDLGVRGYLALWGFNTDRERMLAQKEGFTLLSLEGLKHLGEPPH